MKNLFMAENYYMKNRHKLLLMVQELHKRGYGLLRVVPSLSASGTSWRCSFIEKTIHAECIASFWISDMEEKCLNGEITLSPKEMADLFVREKGEFVVLCKGGNERYTRWYREMMAQLDEDELPYAFADRFTSTDYWRTSKGKERKILLGEYRYYYN